MPQLASPSPIPSSIQVERPELNDQLTKVFLVLSQAGVMHPVAFGLGVSALDNGQPLRYLDVVALQPEYGICQIQRGLVDQGLMPLHHAGATIVTDLLLSFPEFDVSLRLREGVVREQQGRKELTPLRAADLVYALHTPIQQIAADASGAVYVSPDYLKLRNSGQMLCRNA
jgi:hypothetical protein